MQNFLRNFVLFGFFFCAFFSFQSCKDKGGNNNEGLPVLANTRVTDTSHSKATISYDVTSDGGNTITEQGLVFASSPAPTTSSNKRAFDTTINGSYVVRLRDLMSGTKFYARPYAINSAGTSYGPELSFTTKTLKIGDTFSGGIVFYIDGSGQHGLTCVPAGMGFSGPWGCKGTAIGTTSTAIGSGSANTLAVIKVCPTAGIATRVCKTLIYNGFNDWYLPSKDEEIEMYKQRTAIGFNSAVRWSSSEVDADNAWAHDFSATGTPVSVPKDSTLGLRAIRSF